MKKRTFFLAGAGIGGALLVGWGLMPARSRLGAPELMLPKAGDVALNGWIKITRDGRIVMAMPRSEMGQGVHTALPMLVAEELDVPLASVQIAQSAFDAIYGNVAMLTGGLPFHPRDDHTTLVKSSEWMVGKMGRELGLLVTGGSSSVADAWEPVRLAAATVRAQLVAAAANLWKVDAAMVTVAAGRVTSGNQSASFAELATAAAGMKPTKVTPKDPKDYQLIGTAAPRNDLRAKVTGQAVFGLDVRLPGMLYAAIRLCPMIGGSPGAVDSSKALAMPGVLRVVALPALGGNTAGLAVVAETTWHARQGAAALAVQWQQRPAGALNSAQIEASLQASAKQGGGFSFHQRGDVDAAEKSAARTIEALYTAPYLAHATLEPMNCTAQFKDGQLTLWAPTQVPEIARDAAALAIGIPKDKATLNVTLLGGGFGRRLEVDYAAQAAWIARETGGRPVQLVYSREEDTTHDFYRPASAAYLSASLDAQGQVSSLRIQSAGDAITPRIISRIFPKLPGGDTPDKTTSEGLFDIPYALANQHTSHVATLHGVPIGFWRSVGHSHNAFFSECFIDELAAALKQDPVTFRLALLRDAPRHAAVLKLAAEKAGWNTAAPAGRARGVALHESFGSVVAQVMEVSITQGKPRIHRVVCAIDCGRVINPAIIAQQVEGSVIYGLTAALWGRVDIKDGLVQQSNFPSYPLMTLAQSPQVETHLILSTAKPSGVGEPAVPPVAAALANALFPLTGERRRALPLWTA
jgi:isoquinoline 1-oxidoreductase subunit beta